MVETKDGGLYETSRYIEGGRRLLGPGRGAERGGGQQGCGEMRLRFAEAAPGEPVAATG